MGLTYTLKAASADNPTTRETPPGKPAPEADDKLQEDAVPVVQVAEEVTLAPVIPPPVAPLAEMPVVAPDLPWETPPGKPAPEAGDKLQEEAVPAVQVAEEVTLAPVIPPPVAPLADMPVVARDLPGVPPSAPASFAAELDDSLVDDREWLSRRRPSGPFVAPGKNEMADQEAQRELSDKSGSTERLRGMRRPVMSPWQKLALSSPDYGIEDDSLAGDVGPLMGDNAVTGIHMLATLSPLTRNLLAWAVSFFAATVATALALSILPSAPIAAALFVGVPALLGARFVIKAFMPGMRGN